MPSPLLSLPPWLPPLLLFTQADLLLEAAQVAVHLGQLVEGGEDGLLLADRPGRAAGAALARGDVAGPAGAGGDHGPAADVDVVGNARLPRDYHVVARAGRAGDAHLADEQVVAADLAVVA